jgi:hypothetical protein
MSNEKKDVSTRGTKAPNRKGGSGAKGTRPGSDPTPTTKGVFGVKGGPAAPGTKNPSRRCRASVKRTGEQCRRAAIKGGTVCTTHGGAAPQVQKSAKQRLLDLADPAIAALAKIVRDDDTDDAVRVRAALGILDRVGYGPGSKISLDFSKFDEVMAEVLVDRSDLTAIEGGGGLGDLSELQHASDARSEAWSEYDAEDDQRATSGRIFPDENTVRGEVIDSRLNDAPEYARQDPRSRAANGL